MAADEARPFTVDNENGNRRSSSSPITRGSIFRGGSDSSAFPMADSGEGATARHPM
jgi:hypothetical protein